MPFMTAKNRIQILQDQTAKVSLWAERVAALSKKKKPMSEAQFCKKHKLHKAGFNRNKKSVETGENFPTERTIKKVEKALKAEGV